MEEKELYQKSYTRVIEYIKEQITSGSLAVGSKLPSERDLSAILGISRSSVREAIRTLDIMGVITSRQGAGNYLTGNFEHNLSLIIDILQAPYDVIDRFTSDLRKEIISSPDSKFILWEAYNNMLRSLVTRDKELAYKTINMYFDMLDLQEMSLKR